MANALIPIINETLEMIKDKNDTSYRSQRKVVYQTMLNNNLTITSPEVEEFQNEIKKQLEELKQIKKHKYEAKEFDDEYSLINRKISALEKIYVC